jgi:hypothetical protein
MWSLESIKVEMWAVKSEMWCVAIGSQVIDDVARDEVNEVKKKKVEMWSGGH